MWNRSMCHSYEWMSRLVSLIWMSHLFESCPSYDWVIDPWNRAMRHSMNEWVVQCHSSRVTHMNESSSATHMNEWVVQCHSYEWVTYSSRVTHMTKSFIRETAPCVTQYPACFYFPLFLGWRRPNLTQLNHWTHWFRLEIIIDFPFGFFPINNIVSLWITRPSGWWCASRLNYRSLLQNMVFFVGLFCKRDL